MITSTPVTTATVDVTYFYPVAAADASNGPLTFVLTTAPVGMRLYPTTGLIEWTPIAAGEFPVAFSVTNAAGLRASQAYTLTVTHHPDDGPPALQPIGDLTAPLGATLRLQLSAADPEAAAVTYSATPVPLPEGITVTVY